MKKFTFDKKEPKLLTVCINDKKYSFNPGTLTVQKASERFVKCQEPLVNRMKKKGMSEKELSDIVIKSCTLVRDTVNSILGKNAYERIFAGRTVDFEEHQKLITYLFEEITEFAQNNSETETPNEPLS